MTLSIEEQIHIIRESDIKFINYKEPSNSYQRTRFKEGEGEFEAAIEMAEEMIEADKSPEFARSVIDYSIEKEYVTRKQHDKIKMLYQNGIARFKC